VRLLLITGSFPPQKCGVGDYTFSLTRALAEIPDIKIGVLTSATPDMVNAKNGIEVYPIIKRWDISDVPKIIGLIRKWSPDIVHVQYPTQGYRRKLLPDLLPLICFLMGAKIVQTWHEGFGWLRAPQFFMKAMIPGSLLVVRPQYRESLPSFMRWVLESRDIHFIPNASSVPRASLSNDERIALRMQTLKGQQRLVVFFGFVHPPKGVTLLFDIADPSSDHVVIAGDIDQAGKYKDEIQQYCSSEPWLGKVTISGFLTAEAASKLLSVADAVILPFRTGGGEWNTSIHSAVLQGTLVITTSKNKIGYDILNNIHYSSIDDVASMKNALNDYAGTRRTHRLSMDDNQWKKIAYDHNVIYKSTLANKSSGI
jgi:glycosyltransferase involved in cell wall biosynthesis